MKTLNVKKSIWTCLSASLFVIPQSSFAEWVGKGKEVDYLGRELSVPPKIGLLEDGHRVTHALVGKAMYFKSEVFSPGKPGITVVHFDSEKWVTVWDPSTPDKTYRYSYVVFEVAKNIYYLNWAENTAPDMPYEGAWLAAILVDLNRMTVTDTYTSPTEEGKVRYYIEQMKIAVEDIAKAKGDKHYVPKWFAVNN